MDNDGDTSGDSFCTDGADKPSIDKWIVTSGKDLLVKTWRWLCDFVKPEHKSMTDITKFGGIAQSFQFSHLFPIAVCCFGFGWLVMLPYALLEHEIEPESRWAIIPLAALALYLEIRGIRHFIRPKVTQWDIWIAICLFTATVGFLTLLTFQHIANWAADTDVRRGPLAIVKIIGMCYRSVLNPDAKLSEKFMGYIGGVGLCEESVKILPVCILYMNRHKLPFKVDFSFRSFLMLGFFSGLGFGIGEALSPPYCLGSGEYAWRNPYASQLIRWFACVPSHAIYTMIDAAFLWILKERISRARDFRAQMGWFVLSVAAVAFLHGIYDTLSGLFFGIALDSASLVLLWFAVRSASKRSLASIAGHDTLFADFDVNTRQTFGKSFAKAYLAVLAGIIIYGSIFSY